MGRGTPRRRRAKQPPGRFAYSNRTARNENFRYVDRFGKHVIVAFFIVLFTGYVLILRPDIQVTVSQEAVYALGGLLSGTAFRALQ
ncbi:hypothetical protein, partial [Streptomyces sp. NPDC057199]|uniref:hypothetical protein n=1 Tax=Streptomyces sp. NPDC057199 TaxID=3346047 RepID=UPI003634E8BF